MMFEHRILSIASRDAAEIADAAATQLDILSAGGWHLASAYALESPLSATVSHFFVLQRPKHPTTDNINKGATSA